MEAISVFTVHTNFIL